MQSWQLDHRVLQADDCGRSVPFRAAPRFLYLLYQTSLGVFWSTGQQLQPWFPVVPSSFSCSAVFICTHCFSDSAAVTRGSLSSNLACRLYFTLGSGSVHLQFLRLGTFPLGRRLEGKGVFAAYQSMISVTVCTRHQSGMWYASLITLPS